MGIDRLIGPCSGTTWALYGIEEYLLLFAITRNSIKARARQMHRGLWSLRHGTDPIFVTGSSSS